MNRLNWIQQEQKIADYHVLTWRTSHFHHPRNRTDIVGSFTSKTECGGAAAQGAQPQAEGIGQGLTDPFRNTQWKTGGLGTDGILPDGAKDAKNHEIMSTSHRTEGRHTTASESVTAVMQTVMPEEVYSVLNSARQSIMKVHGRIRKSVAKLGEFSRKRSKQAATAAAFKAEYRKPPEKEQQGTRCADREDMLSMQAENHYLLDSYDRNGQYSILGK